VKTIYYQGPAPYIFTVNGTAYTADGTGSVCVLDSDVAAVLALPLFSRYPVTQALVPQSQYGQD